jgi:hypothetical protein
MKNTWAIFLLASSAAAADLTVFTTGDEAFPPAVTSVAKDEASRMFGAIGVHVSWRTGDKPARDATAVQVRFAAARGVHPGAMAFAQPFDPESEIVVFCYRIAAITELRPDLRGPMLSHVLVHEIGHVLMRTNAHTPEGVMKAHWIAADYSEMVRRPLRFQKADAELIQSTLRGRGGSVLDGDSK